jgi:hypothetical protein
MLLLLLLLLLLLYLLLLTVHLLRVAFMHHLPIQA